MALIEKTVLQGIADRAASQYQKVAVAFETINFTSVTAQYYWQRVTETDDPDVEIPLLNTYYSSDYNLTLATCVRNGCASMINIVTQMDTHFSRVGQTNSWDGYCTDEDLRMSDYFNQLHKLAKGQYMLANNVFSETEDVFGTAEVIGGPAVDFTDGTSYGTGASTNRADGSNFAPTQLKAVVDTGITIGGTDLDLRLSVKDPDNNPTTIDVTIPSGSTEGTEVDIGTSSDRFLDVTNIDFKPAGNQGTVGDKVRIEDIKEREISM